MGNHAPVSAVFLAAILAALPRALADPLEQERFEEVRARLVAEAAVLVGQGYKREALEIVTPLAREGGQPFQLELVAGTTYAIIAACDSRCEHVQVAIDDPAGNRLAESPEKAGVVIVGGTPPESGLHRGVVQAPGCGAMWCQVGLTVLRREGK